MKKIWILLFLPLMACNDWLTIQSENAVTLTGFFKNENEVESWVYSIWKAEEWVSETTRRNMHSYCGLVCSDAGYNEAYRRLDPVFCLDLQNMIPWQGHYNLIYLADVLIENRHRFEGMTDQRADFWLAQAHFARAYAYFDLARKWGEAPIPRSSESSAPEPKRPVEEVLAEAISSAKAALILPKHEELRDSYGAAITSKQCASIGTVHTLLANIYAWMGGLYGQKEYWELAEAEASEVIDGRAGNYDLEQSLEQMIKNCLGGQRKSVETIFDIEQSNKDIDYTQQTSFLTAYIGMELIDYPYLSTNPQSIENDTESPKITVQKVKEIYPDEQDQRRARYWYRLGEVKYAGPAGQDSVVSEYAFLDKWNEAVRQENPDLADQYTGIIVMDGNKVVWRMADLILLRAECRARLGLATAKDDLDRIRTRAGLRKYEGNTDPETLRKEIYRERTREMYGEDFHYYAIVRNGYFRDELEGYFKTLTDEDVKNGALYLPVHKLSFNKNVYMKQNIYWQWQQ